MGDGSASCASVHLMDIPIKSSFRGGGLSEPIIPDDIPLSGLLRDSDNVFGIHEMSQATYPYVLELRC